MNKVVSPAFLLLLCLSCVGDTSAVVREPAVAGQFYPADSAGLAAIVENHLANVSDLPPIDGELIALIVPHAGLIYSGQIAAYGYKLLEKAETDKVILCGPSHRFRFEGVSVYGPGVTWKTPLGQVRCHDSLCNFLLKQSQHISVEERAHAREHSLEVQLPYLQVVLKDFEIVPAVMGIQDQAAIDLLASALLNTGFDDNTIMIASTDWQHFHSASEGWKMDSLGIECLKNLDPDRLENLLGNRQVEMCGGGPAVAVLRAAVARGADKVRILRYGDSGDISRDKSSVVSYVAAAIYKSADSPKGRDEAPGSTDRGADPEPPVDYYLTDAEKAKLLEIARLSIEGYLGNKTIPEFDVPGNLREPGAAFVTLKQNGALRGCIGHTVAQDALYKTVSVCGVQAAVADRRFQPVQLDELPKLDIEISVLTPLQQIKSFDEIEVGRDGLMIAMGDRRGLLLPQVATEYAWSRTEFLEQTCRKAGLQRDAYLSPDAAVYIFQAEVFGEK